MGQQQEAENTASDCSSEPTSCTSTDLTYKAFITSRGGHVFGRVCVSLFLQTWELKYFAHNWTAQRTGAHVYQT